MRTTHRFVSVPKVKRTCHKCVHTCTSLSTNWTLPQQDRVSVRYNTTAIRQPREWKNITRSFISCSLDLLLFTLINQGQCDGEDNIKTLNITEERKVFPECPNIVKNKPSTCPWQRNLLLKVHRRPILTKVRHWVINCTIQNRSHSTAWRPILILYKNLQLLLRLPSNLAT